MGIEDIRRIKAMGKVRKQKQYTIPKISKKKKEQLELNKSKNKEKPSEQEQWYKDRNKEMTGRCVECGEKSTKGHFKYWKYSICHILPKSIFPSIATHPLNFIELCYFGNSHHSNMDNNGYEYVRENMPKTWKIIVDRFKEMFPLIKEKSKIPDILLQEIEP